MLLLGPAQDSPTNIAMNYKIFALEVNLLFREGCSRDSVILFGDFEVIYAAYYFIVCCFNYHFGDSKAYLLSNEAGAHLRTDTASSYKLF